MRCAEEYHHTPSPELSDQILGRLKPGSLHQRHRAGEGRPGCRSRTRAVFPERAIAWDFNYRGDLVFLDQARVQQKSRNLRIEDGWLYFVYGWTYIIGKVFRIEVPMSGPVFDELAAIAARRR
jgi:hypothetical protein